jgi:hypothetical protein
LLLIPVHISSDDEIEASVPCSLLHLKEYVAPIPPSDLPTSDAGLVQLAFSIVKENLLHLDARHRQRPVEAFDVMEFRPSFTSAFGFKGLNSIPAIICHQYNFPDNYRSNNYNTKNRYRIPYI